MKNLIEEILENFKNENIIEEDDMSNIEIFNEDEYCDIADTSKEEAHSLWGDFDYVLMFSDYPDYCFLQKKYSKDNVHQLIAMWLDEMDLAKFIAISAPMPFNLDEDDDWMLMVDFVKKEHSIDLDLHLLDFDITSENYSDNQTGYILVSLTWWRVVVNAIHSYGDFQCWAGVPHYKFDEKGNIIGFINICNF